MAIWFDKNTKSYIFLKKCHLKISLYYRLSNWRVILFLGPIVVPIANSILFIGSTEVIRYLRNIEAINAFVVWRANRCPIPKK